MEYIQLSYYDPSQRHSSRSTEGSEPAADEVECCLPTTTGLLPVRFPADAGSVFAVAKDLAGVCVAVLSSGAASVHVACRLPTGIGKLGVQG